MYHRGGSNAEWRRLKIVPPVAFNWVRTNLMEGGLDVHGGDVRSSPARGPRRRDERPGSGGSKALCVFVLRVEVKHCLGSLADGVPF